MSVAPEPAWELDPTRQPVLVVEDNRETVLIYEKFLRGTGYQILAARTISGARQLLQRFRPAAVVLDILLNHENAWDFLGELKHNKATCDIPVLVVTLVANEAKACALGADVFHTKPIERQWLVDQLNRLVRPQRRDEVLIIDDEEISRYVLAGLLSETRFSVIEAHNGRQALDVARARRPSAIFLDLMMPDLNGYEFLEKLQADPELKRIPVIVHTSKALSDNERHQLAACTAAVIQKTHGDRDASLQRIREALVSATQPTLHTPPHGAA